MPLYALEDIRPSLPEDGSAWIAPSADVIGDARLGRDVGIWFGAVVRADNTPIVIGDRTNIQEGAMLHSDPGSPLTIGSDVTIGHHAILHGCTIGNNVLIGMGATVLNNAVIGDNCLIGAGALVTEGRTFLPGSLILGVPAKAIRILDDAAITALTESARNYVERKQHYAMQLRPVDRPD